MHLRSSGSRIEETAYWTTCRPLLAQARETKVAQQKINVIIRVSMHKNIVRSQIEVIDAMLVNKLDCFGSLGTPLETEAHIDLIPMLFEVLVEIATICFCEEDRVMHFNNTEATEILMLVSTVRQ